MDPKPNDSHHQPASDTFQRDDLSADAAASAQVAELQADGWTRLRHHHHRVEVLRLLLI